jgi:pseudomonalisin
VTLSRTCRPLVATAALALLATGVAGVARADSAPQASATTVLTRQVVPGLDSATRLGDTPAGTRVHLAVSLASRNATARDALHRAMTTPGSPSYGSSLTPSQFRASFGTLPAVAARVRRSVTAQGLSVGYASPDGGYLILNGTAAQAGKTFAVQLGQYRRIDGSTFRAYTGAPTVPTGVTAVLGLTDLDRHRTHQSGCARTQATCIGTTVPADLWSVYHQPSADRGRGQKVAIFGEGSLDTVVTDLRKFEAGNPSATNPRAPLPVVPVRRIYVNDDKTDKSGLQEWDLDSQAITGMAPELARLDFYFGQDLSDSSIGGTYAAWANDPDGPQTGNSSFGGCELLQVALGAVTALDPLLQQAAMEGRTMFVSTGDVGGSCSVGAAGANGVSNGVVPQAEYPSSSPFVVAVGGTVLYTDAVGAVQTRPAKRTLEYAWPYTGGGASNTEPRPKAQEGISLITQPCAYTTTGGLATLGTICRAVPDVAAQSGDLVNGYGIVSDGVETATGGTSLSSPLWVGMWARVLAAHPVRGCTFAATDGSLGFAQPALYQVGKDPSLDRAAFFDIGNTDGTSSPTGNGQQVALPRSPVDPSGWDYVSGLGVPDVTGLMAPLDCGNTTPVVAVNPAYPLDATALPATGPCPPNGTATDPAGDTTASVGFTTTPVPQLDQLDLRTSRYSADAAAVTAATTVVNLAAKRPGDELQFQWDFTYDGLLYDLLADDGGAGGTPSFSLQRQDRTTDPSGSLITTTTTTLSSTLAGSFDPATNRISVMLPYSVFNATANPAHPLALGSTLSGLDVLSLYSTLGDPVDVLSYGSCSYDVSPPHASGPPSAPPGPSPRPHPGSKRAAAQSTSTPHFVSCPRTFRPRRARTVVLSCGLKPAQRLVVKVLQRDPSGTFRPLMSARSDAEGRFRVNLPARSRVTLRLQAGGTTYTFTLIPRSAGQRAARAV